MSLSFDPEQPFAGVNLGLSGSFDAQKENAARNIALTDDQYQLISQLQDPKVNLAYRQAAANASGNVPQLHFGGTTFGEGLGNGVNNYLAMRGYKQQQQAYKDIAQQQQAYQQKQLQMAQQQIQAQQQRRANAAGVINPQLRDIYNTLSPEGQDKLLGDVATKEIGVNYTPIESQAKSKATIQADQDKLNWQRERFHALTGVNPEEAFALGNQGALTPQMQSAWKYVYNTEPPKDALDYKKRYADVASDVEGARGATIDNQTRGQRNQASLDNSLIGNAIQQVNLKYADAMKQADLLLSQGKADDAQKLKTNLQEGMARFNQATQKYDQMTPGQVDMFNAQMKAIGLPYALPAKQQLKAVTSKGKVTEFYDPYTGQVKQAER